MLDPISGALIAAIVTAIAAGLRLHLLGARSLWIDEAASVNFATMPWWPFLRLLWSYQGNMTLYYLLLRGWVHLGDSEAVVRGLSVLFGVLTVPAVYALGARLFDRLTGLTAAAILAVHSFHIQWSQEARAYSLLTFLLVLTTYFLISTLESPRSKSRWMALMLSAALSVYAHIFAVLVFPAYALALIFSRPFRFRMRSLAATVAGFGLLIFPISLFVLLHHSSQINWIPRPTLADIYRFLDLLAGHAGPWLAALCLLLAAVAAAQLFAGSASEREKWSLRLLLFWLVLPPMLTLAATPIKPLFYSRYMIVCVPALTLLAARGITQVAKTSRLGRPLAAACVVAVISLSAWGSHRYFAGSANPTEDWRSAVGYILQEQQPDDGAVFFIPNAYAYLYYVQRAEVQHRVTQAPPVLYPTVPPQPASSDQIQRLTGDRTRVWLILCNQSVAPETATMIQSTLEKHFLRRESRMFPGEDPITVLLYSRAVHDR
jgi:mannosyltransferase